MQQRHTDKKHYFNEQVYTTEKYVMPFLAGAKPIVSALKILEIGCGEAGNLKPFLDLGCRCTGVDLSAVKIENGKTFLADHPYHSRLTLVADDIYNFTDFSVKYDIIMLRDVIEHIHDQSKFILFMQHFMHRDSIVFFAFPPWQNPFGGHQQICKSKILSNLPYFHLFPKSLYKCILKLFGESAGTVDGLLEIKETGISTERFEKIVKKSGLQILKENQYFINPNYEIKFGLKPRKLFRLIKKMPVFRNFFITCGYYLVGKK